MGTHWHTGSGLVQQSTCAVQPRVNYVQEQQVLLRSCQQLLLHCRTGRLAAFALASMASAAAIKCHTDNG